METRREQMTTGGIDGHSNFSGDDSEYQDWYGCGGRSRDSGCLEESNFACTIRALEAVDPEGEDHRVESYGHWAVGWIEEIYVRPGSPCFDAATEIEAALSDYPVLDESDFSERETEAANETWSGCFGDAGRIAYIRENPGQFDFHDWADLRAVVRGDYFTGYASELLA